MSVYLYAILGAQPASCGNGVCAEPLRLVVSGDLVAVVGDVPDTPELTAMTLRAQDGVLRRLAAAVDAVLPARFGTLLADDAAVTEALARRRGPLAQALGRVAGCEQMTVRVWGDGAATAPAAESATGGGPGTRYLAQRRQAQEQAQRVPELEPLRRRLGELVRAERVERHDRPPLLATVQHLVPRGAGGRYVAVVVAALRFRRGRGVSAPRRPLVEVRELESLRAEVERQAEALAPRWNANPEDVQKSVARLVLTLVEFIRQLLERQAIRRMEGGTLTAEETENVGVALMRLEETVRDMAARFGLAPDELNLDLGPLGRLL